MLVDLQRICRLLIVSVFLCIISFNISVQEATSTSQSRQGSKNYSLRVDKRIELLSVVQLFTSWGKFGMYKENYTYKKDVLDFFDSSSNHNAVTLCQNLLESGFSYDAPVSFMMYLSDPPELNVIDPFSEYHIGRAGGKEALDEFVESLRSFYLQSNFEQFWNAHQEFYHVVEERANASIPLESTVKTLEDYFGMKQHGYHVILAPLFARAWGYGGWVKVDNSLDIFSFLGPLNIENDIPVFGAALFHEFAHSFVNPLTDEFQEVYKNPDRLYKPIEDKMKAMAYGNWITMINEHILRAVEIKVFNRTDQIFQEEARGFIYIRPLFNLLSDYNRSKYESFREFYPEIVSMFNEISSQQIPFIETPMGIAIISGGIIFITVVTIYIIMRRKGFHV